jgi:hypothetical protein
MAKIVIFSYSAFVNIFFRRFFLCFLTNNMMKTQKIFIVIDLAMVLGLFEYNSVRIYVQ